MYVSFFFLHNLEYFFLVDFSLAHSAPRLGFWSRMLGTLRLTGHAWWGKASDTKFLTVHNLDYIIDTSLSYLQISFLYYE